MRKLFTLFLIVVLSLVIDQAVAQPSNKPNFHLSKSESLGERDNSFSTGRGGGGGLFNRSAGFNHSKSTQAFSFSRKKSHSEFFKKHYTTKRNIFGFKKHTSHWGGKSFKSNGREDKRLFKAPSKNSRHHKK